MAEVNESHTVKVTVIGPVPNMENIRLYFQLARDDVGNVETIEEDMDESAFLVRFTDAKGKLFFNLTEPT